MEDTLSYTFEARMFPDSEWRQSVGRWDNIEGASQAAAEWLTVCTINGNFGAVQLTRVSEWELINAN